MTTLPTVAEVFHDGLLQTAPTVAETAERIKREVLADIAAGVVPADVADYSQLHDYVDANTYGGMCDGLSDLLRGRGDDPAEAWVAHCNAATTIVDAWLVAGRPLG